MSHHPSPRLSPLIVEAAPALQIPMVIKCVGSRMSTSNYRQHLAHGMRLTIVKRVGDRGSEILGCGRSLSLAYTWDPPIPTCSVYPKGPWGLDTVWGSGTGHVGC